MELKLEQVVLIVQNEKGSIRLETLGGTFLGYLSEKDLPKLLDFSSKVLTEIKERKRLIREERIYTLRKQISEIDAARTTLVEELNILLKEQDNYKPSSVGDVPIF